jgi:hypothetical protein
VTDRRTSAAHAASQQATPLREGVVDMEKLPVAGSRGCQPMVRKLTTPLVDALTERGCCDLVTDPPTAPTRATFVSSGVSVFSSLAPDPTRATVRALARLVLEKWHRRVPGYHLRQGTRARPDWPSGLIGIDIPPLIFPAEAYAAR